MHFHQRAMPLGLQLLTENLVISRCSWKPVNWRGHRTGSRCFGNKALRKENTVPRPDVDVRLTPRGSGLQGGRIQLAGSGNRASLQPPIKPLVFSPRWVCFPGVSEASSGGSALRRVVVVTVQETQENSTYDGENPLRPATFAGAIF